MRAAASRQHPVGRCPPEWTSATCPSHVGGHMVRTVSRLTQITNHACTAHTVLCAAAAFIHTQREATNAQPMHTASTMQTAGDRRIGCCGTAPAVQSRRFADRSRQCATSRYQSTSRSVRTQRSRQSSRLWSSTMHRITASWIIRSLPGYSEYQKRVRHRLVLFLW